MIHCLSFTGIYKEQLSAGKCCPAAETPDPWDILDCSGISGTNGYCDEEASKHIRRVISKYPLSDTFFLDNGNYHYISALRLQSLTKDCTLIVFDHHSDMQAPSFGDILSCGGWILYALTHCSHIREVIIIGAASSQYEGIPEEYRSQITFIDESHTREEVISSLAPTHPVFISIDKDVLSPDVVSTNWDQGTMTIEALCEILSYIKASFEIIGCDICGECLPDSDASDINNNKNINDLLISCLYS